MDAVVWKQILYLIGIIVVMFFALRIMKKVQDPPQKEDDWENIDDEELNDDEEITDEEDTEEEEDDDEDRKE